MIPTPVHVYNATGWATYSQVGGWFVGVPVECKSPQCKKACKCLPWASVYVAPTGEVYWT